MLQFWEVVNPIYQYLLFCLKGSSTVFPRKVVEQLLCQGISLSINVKGLTDQFVNTLENPN